MKNFPHQISDFRKLRDALRIFRELCDQGLDAGDDGVFGYALIEGGVLRFQGQSPSESPDELATRVANELAKPSSRQGPRTTAREVRRTLDALGFVRKDEDGWVITPTGNQVLVTPSAGAEERDILQTALLALEMVDVDGNVSHPVHLILRLIAEQPENLGPARRGLELALEALDDSEQEYERIVSLLRLPYEDRLQRLGVSKQHAENAVKILPKLAEQAELIQRTSQREPYTLTNDGQAANEELATSGKRRSDATSAVDLTSVSHTGRLTTVQEVDPTGIANSPTVDVATWRVLSEQEQYAAKRLRVERTEAHQDLVQRAAQHLRGAMSLFESITSFDMVALPLAATAPILLFEAKTLRRNDVLSQVMRAIAQLQYYRFLMSQDARFAERQILCVALFDSAISSTLATFLNELGIAAVMTQANEFVALNAHARSVEPWFTVSN